MKKYLCLLLSLCFCVFANLSLAGCQRLDNLFESSPTASSSHPSRCVHVWKLKEKKEPDCREIGQSLYTCSNCGDSYIKYEPTCHTWDYGEYGYPENCFYCGLDYIDWIEQIQQMEEDGLL